ncbi:MAG: amino acid permease, partial [Gemmatimonas sp.]|nr:amino acid permease [Gemmatimonas sp.]
LFASFFAGLFPIGILGHLVSIGTLFAFMIVCAGILLLRYKRPELERPFRTPLVPFVPLGGIIVCGYLMYSLPPDTWLRLAVWMALGLAIYFLYGRRHSKLAQSGS